MERFDPISYECERDVPSHVLAPTARKKRPGPKRHPAKSLSPIFCGGSISTLLKPPWVAGSWLGVPIRATNYASMASPHAAPRWSLRAKAITCSRSRTISPRCITTSPACSPSHRHFPPKNRSGGNPNRTPSQAPTRPRSGRNPDSDDHRRTDQIPVRLAVYHPTPQELNGLLWKSVGILR
jgi:hypothetical protein